MNTNTAYSKSISGMSELANRTLKLPQALRRVLILVDGTQTQQQLTEASQKVGAPADAFQQLLAMGLIAPVEFGFGAEPAAAPSVRSMATPQMQAEIPQQKVPHVWPNAASTSNSKPIAELATIQRQLVKLIEKHLGPSGTGIALIVEAATNRNDFMVAAMKTKGILHNLKPASVNDPFWATIRL